MRFNPKPVIIQSRGLRQQRISIHLGDGEPPSPSRRGLSGAAAGYAKALDFLRRLRDVEAYELWTGAMQRAEVVFFMKPEEEESTLLLLSQFKTAAVNQEVIDQAAVFHRQWHPSHGLDINDAILAATAAHTGGQIFCLNKKHYPMPDLLGRRAW